MQPADTNSETAEQEVEETTSKAETNLPKRSRIYRLASVGWTLFMVLLFIVVGFQIGGLVRFIDHVSSSSPAPNAKADGIVVLTGGENRIREAMILLDEKRGKRVLITGVNPDLSEEEVMALTGLDEKIFSCCVDVDRKALDTIDNAQETASWVEIHNFNSLIVVTGAFHMPRALLEFNHAIEGVNLIAHPVNVPNNGTWWRQSERLRDLVREYSKLAIVRFRDQMNMLIGAEWPNMPLRKSSS